MKRASTDERLTSKTETPAPKRSRVSRACDQCRASREKCDGAQPICESCTSQQRECTYNDQPKKRGIQPNYIRTLELALAWMLQAHPEGMLKLANHLCIPNDPIARLLAGKSGSIGETVADSAVKQDIESTDSLHLHWRNSIICRQIEQLLSGSAVENVDNAEEEAAIARHDNRAAVLPVPLAVSAVGEVDQVCQNVSQKPTGLLSLPLNAWDLLEHYFAFTHCWMPLVEKTRILKLMYAYPSEGLSMATCRMPEHIELWTIIALAELQRNVHTDAVQDASSYAVARSLLPDVTRLESTSYTKALILFSLVEIQRQAWLQAWLLIGAAIRILLASLTTLASVSQQHEDKKALLVSFVLEHAISCELSSPLHLNGNIIAQIGTLDEDGSDEWTPWQDPANSTSTSRAPSHACSTLNTLVRNAMRSPSQLDTDTEARVSLVPDLLANAGIQETTGRRQPHALVASAHSLMSSVRQVDANIDPSLHNQTLHRYVTVPQGPNSCNSIAYSPALTQHMGPASCDTLNQTPKHIQLSNAEPNIWTQITMPSLANSEKATLLDNIEVIDDDYGSNIFEELASLENTHTSQDPDFMRNLGFGPDIDLAEFFGADYQLSDPMLAFAQSSSYLTPTADAPNRSGNG